MLRQGFLEVLLLLCFLFIGELLRFGFDLGRLLAVGLRIE